MSPYDFKFIEKMKKTLKYILIGVFALFIASCTNDDFIEPMNEKPIPSDNRISFFADQNNQDNTKGIELTNTNFTKFNVFAYTSVGTLAPTTTMTSYITNLSVKKTAGTWNYVGDYYWPVTGHIHFFGVATDDATSTGLPPKVTNWVNPTQGYPRFSFESEISVDNVKDLIVAKTINQNNNNNPVYANLSFIHALSRMDFTITNNVPDDLLFGFLFPAAVTITVKSITVSNINKKGIYTFNSGNGSWAPSNPISMMSIPYFSGTQSVAKNASFVSTKRLFIIPSNGVTVTVVYDCQSTWSSSSNISVSLNLPALDIGSFNRFTLKVTKK